MKATIGVLAFVLFSFAVVQAQNWPQWRGPSLNGISNEKNLPVKWSTANGPDVTTPVTDGKYFYVVKDNGVMYCFDARTGAEVYGQQRLKSGTYSGSPVL